MIQYAGIAALVGCAFLLSNNRRTINWRTVSVAFIINGMLAASILGSGIGQRVLGALAHGVELIYGGAQSGISFLFGSLADASGPWGFIFAIRVLPVIIVLSSLISLLMYLGIIPALIAIINRPIRALLGTTGTETICAVANSVLGQTEAPLLIKHRLTALSDSELFVVMVSGMGSVSAAAVAIYTGMGIPATHLLCASVMAIPSTIIMAKIMMPEDQEQREAVDTAIESASPAKNVLEAIAIGALDALTVALQIGAILIAFVSLLALTNMFLGWCCVQFGFGCLQFQDILGYACIPFGWCLGLTGAEASAAGRLLGTKIAINELVAYSDLINMELSSHARTVITYALCGFANLSSIGIQIGGIGALAPSLRPRLSAFGVRAVIAGTLANLLSAAIAGLFI